MLIVFHQSAVIYIRLLSTQNASDWLMGPSLGCFDLVTHVYASSAKTDVRLGIVIERFWRERRAIGCAGEASDGYQCKPQDEVKGSVCVFAYAKADFWSERVEIRMEDCRFGRDVLKWKITLATFTRGSISIRNGEFTGRRQEVWTTDRVLALAVELYVWKSFWAKFGELAVLFFCV